MENKSTVPIATSTYIQKFGSLIILDFDFKVIGISENALAHSKHKDKANVIGNAFSINFADFFGQHITQINRQLENMRDFQSPRQVLVVKLEGKKSYLKLSMQGQQIFIEWEEQLKKYTSAKKINEFSFLLDAIQTYNWDIVCHAINRILRFDHVLVLQLQESGSSQVIAEDNRDGQSYYKGFEYAKTLMPKELVPYYSMCSYRYSPNLNDNVQAFYSIDSNVNILPSQFYPAPELHRLFLSQRQITCAIAFPIHIDGQFWGLLIAQNQQEKKIDLQQRKLCTFAIQNATSKYESYLKQHLLERNEFLKAAEQDLKSDLAKNKTINSTLIHHMDTLKDMVEADGFAIYNQGDVYFHGICPTQFQLDEIITFIHSHTDKSLFKDNNFRLNHGIKISGELPFAGLMYLKIGLLNDHVLIWFRKESASKVINLHINSTIEQDTPPLTITETTYNDVARPWNDIEINFVLNLNQILKESIVSKLKEKQHWNEQLLALNNELEMLTFTLSHDLKNPLSILKIGIQFLQQNKNTLSPEAMQKWYGNLISSTVNIENIINNVVLLCQHKDSALIKDPIPMAYTLQQIYKESSILYQSVPCNIQFGRLLPIWGEKSALYQIFSNLIGNAIKYSTQAPQPQLHIDSYFEDEQVCYTIRDNGIGIPAENIAHIFDIFKRGNNVANIEGTGVGLSLVKRIMDRLGGSIKIESQVESGTAVHLFFPIVEEFPASMLAE